MSENSLNFETQVIHSGGHSGSALSVPIVQSSTFRIPPSKEEGQPPLDLSETPIEFYTRLGNPTIRCLEKAVMELEGADEARAFASGMGAISASILASVQPGGHIVANRCLYGGTREFLDYIQHVQNITTTFVDSTEPKSFQKALRKETQLIYVESPSNPRMDVFDLVRIGEIAKEKGVFSLVDATLASPYNQRPLNMGFQGVLHSATKYYAGHSDVIAGVVAGSKSWIGGLDTYRRILGACISPHDAWLTLRGIKTLNVRLKAQNETTLQLAQFLKSQPLVAAVFYPGLESHPGHNWAKEHMRGFGGTLSFELKGGFRMAQKFLEHLKLFAHAVSLGGVESLAMHPASTTHALMSPEEKVLAQITESLIRISVGLESYEDLKKDLEQAFQVVS